MKQTILIVNIVGFMFALNACKQPQTKNNELSGQGSSLLWRISGNGLTTESYLYGTIHIQDKRVFEFGDTVRNIFEDAEIIAVEVELDMIDYQTAIENTLMKDSVLTQLVTPEEYQFLESKYKELTGASLKTANRVKPFFLSANIINSLINKDAPAPLDIFFIKEARKNNKIVVGLETFYEQIATIDELSYSQQAKLLLESLTDSTDIKESFDKLLDAYLKMNDSMILELTSDPSLPKEFMDKIVLERNYLMTDRLLPLLPKGKVFIAVGAAHLFDNEGIINLLRKKGYDVTPVPFQFGELINLTDSLY